MNSGQAESPENISEGLDSYPQVPDDNYILAVVEPGKEWSCLFMALSNVLCAPLHLKIEAHRGFC